MKSKSIFRLTSLFLILSSCTTQNRLNKIYKESNEIEINKTEMKNVIALAGHSDDNFSVYACGRSSGHTSGWTTYKQFGLAFHSTSYNPAREDGYKNGLVRNIGIFDTTNLNVNRSKQQEIYYEQDFPSISIVSLENVFGSADYVKNNDTLEYHIYTKRKTAFVFHRQTKNFINGFC